MLQKGFANKLSYESAGVTMRGEISPGAPDLAWRKSSYCAQGECVEVGALNGRILMRDSKNPGPVLSFSADEFRAFALGLRAGEYDDLTGAAGS